MLSDPCSSSTKIESLMKDVQTTVKEKVKKHYSGAAILQMINYPTNYSIIWRSYLEGPMQSSKI